MEDSKTYVFGQDSNLLSTLIPLLTNRGIDASTLALLNNNGFGGSNFIWILFLLILGWGGFGGFGGGFGNNGAGFLSNQISNDTGRDLLLQAIQGNGSAINQLAGVLNSDINTITSTLNTLMSAVQSVGSQVGMTGLQTINSIESGNAALSRQLCECCCENRLLTTQQGYESQIRTLEQTNQLCSQADRNTRSITDAISAQSIMINDKFCDVEKRELQDKIDSLRTTNNNLIAQIDNANQTAAITSYVNSLITPLQKEVSEIRACQPNTVPVQWPNIIGVNATPYGGGFYTGFNGYGYGNNFGWGGSYWG